MTLMNIKQENVRISEQKKEFEEVKKEIVKDKKRTEKELTQAQRDKSKTLFKLRIQELESQHQEVQIDSLEQVNVAKSKRLLQIEHDNLKNVREIENLEHLKEVQRLELEKQQNIIYMIGAGVLLALLFAGFFFRLYRTKRQLNLELEAAYYELERIATKDPLTNLSNRRDMLEKIEAEIKRFERTQRPFTVIISDIDHFKAINDNYGHDGGDFILKHISDLVRETIRKQDIVARWGGEEFLFVLPETDIAGGKIIADKIRTKLEEFVFDFNNQKIPVTMTFGVSAYYSSEDIDDTIKRADTALYKGKETGRNKVVLYSEV
jgi:diguanylate cyclase (GGDEF)-like protein